MLNFWASWCIPCKSEAPVLDRNSRRYRSRGLVFLGVDYHDLASDARRFVAAHRLTFPMLEDGSGKVTGSYGISQVPETYVLNRQGRILAHIAGPIVAGLRPSPVPIADYVTTTTHKTLRGPRGGLILCKAEHAKEIDRRLFPGVQGGPLVHIIAAKAVAFGEALRDDFKEYQRQILANAKALCAELQEQGLRIVSGGTDNHLMLVDVWMDGKGITGKAAEKALEAAHITVNKNTIPFDQNKPFVASGLRIGTPAVTTRGMKEPEMHEIGRLIAAVVHAPDSEEVQNKVKAGVAELTAKFPLYARLKATATAAPSE